MTHSVENICSMDGLLYFIKERENIRLRREAGLPREQWTTDPILAKYKFTNIHRKHDRVSKWIIEEIINTNFDYGDLWFSLLIARLVNWPPTLERLLEENIIPCKAEKFDKEKFSKTIESFKQIATGGKVYSGAYMVYPSKMNNGGKKSESLATYIIGDVILHAGEIRNSLFSCPILLSNFVKEMSKCFGISTFIAGQVAADLTYARGYLNKAKDLYSYAPLGPGSQKGLNYLLGRKPYAGWNQEDFNLELIKINEKIKENLGITDLTLHDVQNCMCEYSKYCRAVLGEGKPKTIYRSETEF